MDVNFGMAFPIPESSEIRVFIPSTWQLLAYGQFIALGIEGGEKTQRGLYAKTL